MATATRSASTSHLAPEMIKPVPEKAKRKAADGDDGQNGAGAGKSKKGKKSKAS